MLKNATLKVILKKFRSGFNILEGCSDKWLGRCHSQVESPQNNKWPNSVFWQEFIAVEY